MKKNLISEEQEQIIAENMPDNSDVDSQIGQIAQEQKESYPVDSEFDRIYDSESPNDNYLKRLEEIQKQVRLSKINNLCENELRIRFMEMVTYLGTYKDKKFKKRLFNSFQEFLDSPDILKNQLINGYNSLELSSVNLKGLQEIKHLGEK